MIYSHEVQQMCCVKKGANHESAPIPEEGKWVRAKEIKDISGLTHGIGWCAPQQGACKLTLNVKDGIIQEALVETIGCSGMTHSAAMASEILPGKTILEALNTDLVCDAINTAMRELFKQIVYGRTQAAGRRRPPSLSWDRGSPGPRVLLEARPGLAQGPEPSSGSFSHLPSPEAWRQLEISGMGGRSQRLMYELPVLQTDAPGGRFDSPALEPGAVWDVDCRADRQEPGVELGG